VGCLGNLAREHDDYSQVISKAGGLSLLIALVDKGTDELKDKAAGALWNLSFCEENREAIISAGKAVIEAASDAVKSSDRLRCLKSLVCRVTMHHKDKFYF
jgi:DNA-binding transcriptional regulator PaaX